MKRIKLLLPLLFVFFQTLSFAQTTPIDTIILNCGGFFTDTGDITSDYAANEDQVFLLCPDNTSGPLGTHIQLDFQSLELAEGDSIRFYDGNLVDPATLIQPDSLTTPFTITATAANTSGCLSVHFTSDSTNQAAGWLADINCFTICQAIELNIQNSAPAIDTGIIASCLGQTITLNSTGIYPQNGLYYDQLDSTSIFEWDLGDGTTAIGRDILHTYANPGIYFVDLTISDPFGCSNSDSLALAVHIAPPPTFMPGGIETDICLGDTICLEAAVDTLSPSAAILVETDTIVYTPQNVETDSFPIPDGVGASYQSSITFTHFELGATLEDISQLERICLVIEHSWLFDLDIHLNCPDGTTIILQNQEFISNETYLGIPFTGDDINTPNPPEPGIGFEYCWTADAINGTWTEFVTQFDPPTLPSDDYAPFEDLSNLIGCPLNGEWTLTITDQWASDNGWAFGWGINFAPELCPISNQVLGPFTTPITDYGWQEHPDAVLVTPDSICVVPTNVGEQFYTFEVMDDFGCSYSDSIAVNVGAAEATIIGELFLCFGDSIVLSAETGTDFLWNTGDTTQSILVAEEGSYQVTVSDGMNCIDSAEVMIQFFELPIIMPNLVEDTFCINEMDIVLLDESLPDLIFYGDGITNGLFQPEDVGIGIHPILFDYITPEGCTLTDSLAVWVEGGDCITNTPQLRNDAQVTLLPNPSNGVFSVLIENWEGVKQIELYSAQAQRIHAKSSAEQQIFFSGLSSGVYFIRIEDQNFTLTKKVIVY